MHILETLEENDLSPLLIFTFICLFFLRNFLNCHLQALASTLDEEELADLKDQFDAIDVDKNGSISLEEMRQVGF